MPTLPGDSALSAQSPVTAAQYNAIRSALATIPMIHEDHFTAFVLNSARWEVPSTIPASAPNNRWMYYFARQRVPAASPWPTAPANASAFSLVGLFRNEILYVNPGRSGTWQVNPDVSGSIVDGYTAEAPAVMSSGHSTATVINTTYLRWDLGLTTTASIFSLFQVSGGAGGATASGVVQVSVDGTTFTSLSAHTANGGLQGTAWLTASIPLRYIQFSLFNFGAAGGTAVVRLSEFSVHTASAWQTIGTTSMVTEMVSATHSGGMFALIQSAAPVITAEVGSAWAAWTRTQT